jgi:deoxycytidylate deaminase
MATFISSGGSQSVSLTGLSSPTVANEELVDAGTEYEVTLSPNTRHFTIHARNGARLQLAFQSGESSTNYITIWPGSTYSSPITESGAFASVYVQASKATTTIEVTTYA